MAIQVNGVICRNIHIITEPRTLRTIIDESAAKNSEKIFYSMRNNHNGTYTCEILDGYEFSVDIELDHDNDFFIDKYLNLKRFDAHILFDDTELILKNSAICKINRQIDFDGVRQFITILAFVKKEDMT